MPRRPLFISIAVVACAVLMLAPSATADEPAMSPELGEKTMAEVVAELAARRERETLAEAEGGDGPVRLGELYHPRMAAWMGRPDEREQDLDREARAALEAERQAAATALGAELAAGPRTPTVLDALPGGGMVLRDVEQTRELVLEGVIHIDGPLIVEGLPSLERLVLPDLETVAGLDITGNPALVSVEAPHLRRVAGDVRVRGNMRLTDVQMARLTTVGGQVEILGNSTLADVALPSLSTVESLLVEDNPTLSRCTVESLSTATGGVRFAGNTRLVELSLSALVTVLGDVDVLDNGALAVLEMAALEDVHGALTVALNAQLESLAAARLTHVGRGLSLVANDTLATMALTSLTTVGRLEIEDNQALPTDSVTALQAAVDGR